MIRLILCTTFLFLCIESDLLTVKTSRGSVQGFVHDSGNDTSKRFYGYGQVFLGIPFAKPPLGEKRFALPEEICQYNDRGEVHNATYYRPRCWQTLQPAENTDEDCLYLNVMSPNVSGKYPVLFYVHGGTFTTGGADRCHYKGAIRNLVSRGIVVVTIQYRVAMLGFFTTFTERFPPNRGLYDQIVALRWVNDEIANFGGDPSRITIYGQSAGATCVSELSLSPLARGLFHQVIQSSGSPMQQLETIEDPRDTTVHKPRVQQICGINSTYWGSPEKDEAIMKCLLNASPHELVAFDFTDGHHYNHAIDGALIPDYPENLAKSRPKYHTLIGDMLEEVAMFVPGVPIGDLSLIGRQMNEFYVNASWPIYDAATVRNLSDTMIDAYTGGMAPADDDHLGWTTLITEMNTGLVFTSLMLRDAHWHLQNGNENLWLFTFAHHSLLSFGLKVDGWIPIPHSADLPYLWFYPDVWEKYDATAADLAVADNMGFMWAYFAKNGELPAARAEDEMNYVEIAEPLTLKSGWRKTADQVFNKQFPEYLDNNFPPVKTSDEGWKKLRKLGKKVLSKWNSMDRCSIIASKSSKLSASDATNGASIGSSLAFTILIAFLL